MVLSNSYGIGATVRLELEPRVVEQELVTDFDFLRGLGEQENTDMLLAQLLGFERVKTPYRHAVCAIRVGSKSARPAGVQKATNLSLRDVPSHGPFWQRNLTVQNCVSTKSRNDKAPSKRFARANVSKKPYTTCTNRQPPTSSYECRFR
jgi:hypothetical protein